MRSHGRDQGAGLARPGSLSDGEKHSILNAVTPTLIARGGGQRGSQSRAGCVRSSRRLAIALMSSQPWRLRLKGRKSAPPVQHSRQHSQATVPSKLGVQVGFEVVMAGQGNLKALQRAVRQGPG